MLVIARAVVRLTAVGGGFEFFGERRSPLFPGEISLFRKLHGEGKGLGLPGSANTGPPASRGKAGRFSSSGSESGSVKVVIPHIDVHRIQRRGLLAPKLARGKTHRINVLRFLAKKMRVSIRGNKDAMIAVDDAGFSSHIAWQTRVTNRMHIAAAPALTGLEARGNFNT